MLSQEEIHSLKLQAHHIKPLVNVGKNGLTQATIDEIIKHLKKRQLIKIKVLKNQNTPIRQLVEQLQEQTKAHIVSQVGSTCILYKNE